MDREDIREIIEGFIGFGNLFIMIFMGSVIF